MPWSDPDIATTVSAARSVRETLGARFRSLVPGSSYIGTLTDFILNTNADVYQIRKDVAAIKNKIGA